MTLLVLRAKCCGWCDCVGLLASNEEREGMVSHTYGNMFHVFIINVIIK